MPRGSLCCVCKRRKKEKRNFVEEDKEYIAFHRFPKCRRRRKQWLDILGLTGKNFRADPYDAEIRICSRHFSPDSINFTYPIPRIRDDAIPNIIYSSNIKEKEAHLEISSNEVPEIRLKSLPENIKDEVHVNS